MGFLTGGPYYDLIGRTGNNVGRRTKGKNVFSMRPAKSNRAPSELQLEQRERFGLVTSWLSRFTPLIEVGFQGHPEDQSAMNAAVSYHLKNAVSGIAPNYTINYNKVMISRGKVGEPYLAEIMTSTPATILWSWQLGAVSQYNKPTDKATFLVYSELLGQSVMLQGVVPRSALTYSMPLPSHFSGQEVQCYIGFTNADGKISGNSFYVGEFLVM